MKKPSLYQSAEILNMSSSVLFCTEFVSTFIPLASRYNCTITDLCVAFDTVISRADYTMSGRMMNMTSAEIYAVSLYSFNMIYSQLNADLRAGNSAKLAGYVNLLSSALSKHVGYDTTTLVHKGMKTTPDYVLTASSDVVIRFNGFTSTTPNRQVASDFAIADGIDPCLFIFTAVGGCEISRLCWQEAEQEILFPPGLMFVITFSWFHNGVRCVGLEQVFSTDGFGTVIQS
jgi:hypothetical protein